MESNDLKQLANEANMETWSFLGNPSLSNMDRDKMLAAAYASLYLWEKGGGTEINQARGHWLISRAMCVAGEPKLAAHHAEECARYAASATDRKDFDEVYAIEARARAAALNNDPQKARELRRQASSMAESIADPEDRELVVGDIASEPWFGLVMV